MFYPFVNDHSGKPSCTGWQQPIQIGISVDARTVMELS
jgi:hypothetical protein